jgi:uncharacterized membrane protein
MGFLKNYCLPAWNTVSSPWSRVKKFLKKDEKTCPRSATVLLSLISLIIFLVAAVFAVVFPTTTVKNFIIALNSTLTGVLGVAFAFDLAKCKYFTTLAKRLQHNQPTIARGRAVKKNLINTVLTIVLTISVLTALYGQLWHRGLNDIVVRQETDTVVSSYSDWLRHTHTSGNTKISSCSLLPASRTFASRYSHGRIEVLVWPKKRQCCAV